MKRHLVAAVVVLLTGCGIPDGSHLRMGGAARPEYAPSPLPLHEKAVFFETALARHLPPEGVNIYLVRGEESAAQAMENMALADCAIWTGVLLGAECLRLAVTGEPEARERVRLLSRGLHALQAVTGVPGLYARCLARRSQPSPRESGDWYAGAGEWSAYRWKGDTSQDQYAGVVFGLGLAATLPDDPEVRAGAAADARAVADFLLANKFLIVGPEGRPTRFGDLRGHICLVPRGPSAAISLAALKTAAVATGEERYREAYGDLVRRGYARDAVWAKFQFFGRTNGNNDVMALLSLWNLLRFEEDPSVLALYKKSCRRFRDYTRYDGNSLFNFIEAFALGDERDLVEDGLHTLRLFPLEKRNFSTDVSGREDIRRAFWNGWRGRPQAKRPLPINYRPQSTWVWRDNPRQLTKDAGLEGTEQAAATDFLAAYWLGRYLGFIGPAD